jgi:hypothetical protein
MNHFKQSLRILPARRIHLQQLAGRLFVANSDYVKRYCHQFLFQRHSGQDPGTVVV